MTGTANLGGSLQVQLADTIKSGDRISVLEAEAINGKFDRVDRRFKAEYSPTRVTLIAK